MIQKQTSAKNLLTEIAGWYGTVAIIVAYAMSSFHVLSVNDLMYQVLNGTGAVGIVIISLRKKAYQPAALNAVWTLIAIVAFVQILTTRTT